MCTYKLGRGNKRKGLGDFWEVKRSLTGMIYGHGMLPTPSAALRAGSCGERRVGQARLQLGLRR